MAVESLLALSLIFGTISMAFYGLSSFFVSILSKRDNPIKLTFWYFVISTIILAVIALMFFKVPSISATEAALLAVASVLSVAGLFAFFKSLEKGKLAIVAPISGSWSIITVLVGVLFLKENLSLLQGLGVLATIIGTTLTSFKLKGILKTGFHSLVSGAEYAMAAMLIWGAFYSLIGVLSKGMGWLYPIMIVGIGSCIILFASSSANKTKINFPASLSMMLIVWSVITVIALASYSVGTSHGYVSVVGPIAAASPFIAVILGVLLLKEKLASNQIIGIALILLGIIAIAL